MATSAGGTMGGSALLPIVAAIGIGGPAALAMSLALSESDTPMATRPVLASMTERDDRRPPQSSSAGEISGAVGSAPPRLDLFGSSAPPAPQPGENAGVQIAQLPEDASPQEQADAAAGELAAIEPSAGPPLNGMAGLQSGGASVGVQGGNAQAGGVQGGGSHGSARGGFGGFGGGGFGGGSSGFGGNLGAGAPAGPAPSSAAPPSSEPASQPAVASLTPPPAPQVQPPAPPAGNPGPLVLRPGDVLKGSGPGVPITNDGGTLAAGDSPGEMDIPGYVQNPGVAGSPSILEVEIEGTALRGVDYDYYDVVGDVEFFGGEIEFVFLAGFDFSQSFEIEFMSAENIFGLDTVDLVFTGTIFDPSDFDDLFDVFLQFDGQGRDRLMLSYFAPFPLQQSDDQQGSVTQTPEPEAMLLFGLGLLSLVAARRRLA